MPINAQIPLSVQPMQVQLPDPNANMNALARAYQIKGAMAESDLNALRMQEMQRGIEDQNYLRNALSQPGSDPYQAMMSRGMVKQATEFAKGQADLGKTKADTQKSELDAAIKKAEHAASLFSLAQDPQSYQTVRAVIKQQFGQDMPEQYDPNFVQAQIAAGQTITQKLADLRAQQTQAITMRGQDMTAQTARRGQDMTAATAARGQDITLRGQNMTDARAREANQAGRVPAGYRMTADGGLEFIPGGPADPNAAKRAAPTEFQGKAAMFGTRAAEADKIISQLEGQYSPSGINTKQAVGRTPLVGGALEAGANLALSDQSQKAEQAQRDFVNAVLRLESGAAINQSEFDNAKKQYFPQPGDSPAVVAQKAQNRKTAIQGLMNNARPGAVEVPKAEPAKVVDFGSLK